MIMEYEQKLNRLGITRRLHLLDKLLLHYQRKQFLAYA